MMLMPKTANADEIIIPTKKQLPLVSSIITKSFLNYPLLEYFIPDFEKRKKNSHYLWDMEVKYAFRYGSVYTTKNFKGAIITLDKEISEFKTIRCGSLNIPLRLGIDFIKRQNGVTKILDELKKKYSKSKCTYIWMVGVLPEYQNMKIGSKLIKFAMNEAKNKGNMIYLETSKKSNANFYEYLGFKLMETIHFKEENLTNFSLIWDPSIL